MDGIRRLMKIRLADNISMNFTGKSDNGKKRKNNEDAFQIIEELGLLIVADGIGGNNAGEVASNKAVYEMAGYVKNNFKKRDNLDLLCDGINYTNNVIYTMARENEEYSGMGTTIVVALCERDKVNLIHVGDSRAYLINETKMEQLTEDHSLVFELFKRGTISLEESRHHPNRHIITRSIGNSPVVEPEANTFFWKKGDYLLICTDGLTDILEDEKIRDIVAGAKKGLEEISQELIDSANNNGGSDNITLILAKNK